MASRTSLKDRRASDARGVDAIITPSTELPDTSSREEESHRPAPLSKVTLYVRPEQVLAIEEIQLAQRKRTGKKPDKSDLMQEALDLLIQKYAQA